MDLAVVWFGIVGFLFVGYFVLDGFDFGVGMSLPFLAKDDVDRRVLINTIGPVWDLNETWLIVAGACMFAAFPEWYATLFSGFYLVLLAILLALIVRGVSFEYRHQRTGIAWKKSFDRMIVVGSAVPAFLWGLLFANVVHGVPLDDSFTYRGTVLDLFNGYAILGGVTTAMLFFTHGVIFVSLKTEGEIRLRARALVIRSGIVTIVSAASFLLWTVLSSGSLVVACIAAAAAVSLIASYCANLGSREGWSFSLMALTIVFAVLSLFASLFPNVLPASNDPAHSLTVFNASSSPYTLTVMSWTAVVFLPLILGYQGYTYWVFRKRLSRNLIHDASSGHSDSSSMVSP